jgi:K+/H+ antiporter YhaU regulatory subunit KhtT
VGQTIAGARFRQELGVAVMVIRKPEGQMLVSPEAETALAAEDILILLGPRDQLDKVDELARGTPA